MNYHNYLLSLCTNCKAFILWFLLRFNKSIIYFNYLLQLFIDCAIMYSRSKERSRNIRQGKEKMRKCEIRVDGLLVGVEEFTVEEIKELNKDAEISVTIIK